MIVALDHDHRDHHRLAPGAPELPRAARRGFTVVEWGGANLDEVVEPRAVAR